MRLMTAAPSGSQRISDVVNVGRTGTTADMDFTTYRQHIGLSASVLKHGRPRHGGSMRRLRYHYENESPSTDAQTFGQLMHRLILEPNRTSDIAVWCGGRRYGKDWNQFCDDHQGETIVKADELNRAKELADFVRSDPRVIDMLGKGQPEVSVFGQHAQCQLKGRIDWLRNDGCIVDLKFSRSIAEHDFGRAMAEYGTHLQMGLYSHLLGGAPCCIIAVEHEPPYDVAIVPVPPHIIDDGKRQCFEIVELVAASIQSDRWPGADWGAPSMAFDVPDWQLIPSAEENYE